MNIYAFIAIINTVVSLLNGSFVYAQDTQKPLNRMFGLLSISVIIWSTGYFFWQVSESPESALFWVRVLMAGAIFISIFNFHFLLTFLEKVHEQRFALLLGYLLFTIFFLANLTSQFVLNVEQKFEFSNWPNPGPLFHPFLVLWFLYILYGIVLLLKERKIVSVPKRHQIDYLLLATIIGYGGGATNFLLWYDIPISPVGIWAPAMYVGIVAYAMVTKQLFGIRILLTQLLVGSISLLLFVNFILSTTPFEYFWKGVLMLAFLVSGFLLVNSVVKEIKQREKLQQAYEKLKELDQAKSEFISIASHQLRTPLTATKGYISMILEGSYGKLTAKLQKPIANVQESNERLIKLVNDLLSISRIEAGKITMEWGQASVEDIAQSVFKELQVKAHEKNIKFVLKKDKEPLPQTRIDQEKIRNVLLNIVDNAIRYTSKGSISITAHVHHSENLLHIEITDTGEGMNKQELSHLFESFSRGGAGTRFWTEGAGLGLYIARQFVQMHKGKIWAESPGKGKGSTFFIELPIQ